MSRRVGIFSGSFDPVHDGHLAFALQALEQCKLDKVFFLVEPRPRRKQGVKAFDHRVAMVQLAIANEPRFGSIILDQARFTPNETMPVLAKRFEGAEIHLLMGDDLVANLVHWPHIKDVIGNIKLAVGLRNHTREAVIRSFETMNRTRGLDFSYSLFETDHKTTASRDIKRTLRQGNIPSDLPLTVQGYIIEHKLYMSASSE